MKFDLTITISVVIAICAIASPVITCIMNNKHQLKLKQLDSELSAKKEATFYQRTIYENYLKNAGKCVAWPTEDVFQEYGEYHLLALIYFPQEFHDSVSKINSYIRDKKFESADSELELLAPKLIDHIKKCY